MGKIRTFSEKTKSSLLRTDSFSGCETARIMPLTALRSDRSASEHRHGKSGETVEQPGEATKNSRSDK